MPLLDQTREDALVKLAIIHYAAELTEAERKVLHDSASSEELPDPGEDAPRQEVRPDFLRWLATDPDAAPHIDPKGLRVYAATIPGKLDLKECRGIPTLMFYRCEFQGEIILRSAETRGLYFFDSSLNMGVFADGVIVRGPLMLKRIQSKGEIRMVGSRVEGDITCSGAKLMGEGVMLGMDNAKISGNFILNSDFISEGMIRLPDAWIGGDLSVVAARVAEFACKNMVVKGDFNWLSIGKSEKTKLNLVGAKVKNLRDDLQSWPEQGNLNLDGLVYEELTLHAFLTGQNITDGKYARELPLRAKERIAWIMRQPADCRTEPQPWMQLRDLLERKGDRKGAKHVLFRLRCLQAQVSWVPIRWLKIAFAWLEEAPGRIWRSIVCVLLLGWLVFGFAGAHGALAPTDPVAYQAFITGKPMPAAYPALNPFVYTLENAVPLVKLDQDEKWAPDKRYPGTSWYTNYWFLMWSRWLLILSGWFQATVLAAALADRFKK